MINDKDKLLAGTIEHLASLAVELMRGQESTPKVKVSIRDMKAELAGASSGQPVSYADEFEAAEEIAKLRRDLAEEQGRSACLTQTIETMGAEFERMKARRYEAAREADEYLRERDEAHAKLEKIAARAEAAEKKAQAFPGAELEELREKYAQLQRNRDLLDDDLSVLCRLIVGDEHSSYVLASREVERLKEENGKMKARLSALGDWQTSISAALECSPANAHDRVKDLQAVLAGARARAEVAEAEAKELRAQHKSDSVVGDE